MYLEPQVPERFAATAFERFQPWVVHRLRPMWPAVTMEWRPSKQLDEHHWSHAVYR